MKKFKIASYNVEHMRKLFKDNQIFNKDKAIMLAYTIKQLSPHILGMVEASDKVEHHKLFLEKNDMKYNLVKSPNSRGKQDLVFYHKSHFRPLEIDNAYSFYDEWLEDVNGDGIKGLYHFKRRPLEALFEHKHTKKRFRILLVSNKSKSVTSRIDLQQYHLLSIANRKRLIAQARKIREHIDILLENEPEIPLIIMGDFNDDPGLDSYERELGITSLETIMGSLYKPKKILHNTLWHLTEKKSLSSIWTNEFHDLIVQNIRKRRTWIDHIFVSPNMLQKGASVRYVMKSGKIFNKKISKKTSDHLPIYCEIML